MPSKKLPARKTSATVAKKMATKKTGRTAPNTPAEVTTESDSSGIVGTDATKKSAPASIPFDCAVCCRQ